VPEDIPKLTDVINERVAELIQIGFNAEVKLPMSIVEKRKGIYHRIPEWPLPEWTEYCKYIRGYTDQYGARPGDQLCCACDATKAEEFFSGGKRTSESYICHAGLVDIAIPITVGGKVVAVFFGGQKRLKDDVEYSAQLSHKIDDLIVNIPALSKKKLTRLAHKVPALTESDIKKFAVQLSEIVSYIGDLARRNYEARQAMVVMGRFSEEYMARKHSLSEVLIEIFKEVAEFLSVEHLILIRDVESAPIVSSQPLGFALTESLKITSDLLPTILKKLPNISLGKAFLLCRSGEPELINYIAETLILSNLNAVFIKPISFAVGGKGIFLYINPRLADWEFTNNQIMAQKLEFIDDLSERLRSQIDMFELDREKDDLMAEVTHRLKSPMQWLMSEVSTILPRFEGLKKWLDIDPEIKKSIESVKDIVDFINAQTYNYTIIATMDKEGIACDMKMHPLGILLEQCVSHYTILAQERDIKIKPTIAENCYKRSLFDWKQIEVAVNNLLDNAVKYSHSRQTIWLTASLNKEKNKYIVRFDSYGIGIAPEEHEIIFNKFRRGMKMKDPRRLIPGTGIGLTVARKIARDHGGDLRLVECKQGPRIPSKGYKEEGWKVVFELILPISQENGRNINE
jgi:signal transduction histidine kinase/ligand-binding sensor protein